MIAQVDATRRRHVSVPMQWTGERDGQYRGTFVTTEAGPYEVTVDADAGGKCAGSGITFVRAAAADAEYLRSDDARGAARRIAEETGGRFYTPDKSAASPRTSAMPAAA